MWKNLKELTCSPKGSQALPLTLPLYFSLKYFPILFLTGRQGQAKILPIFFFFFYCSPMKTGPWQAERNEKASLVYRLRQSTKDENMKTWKDACLWDIFSRQLWKECGRDALQVGSQLWRREMSAFLFLTLPVLRFASINAKPSLCVKEDQRHLSCKSSSLGKILLSQR